MFFDRPSGAEIHSERLVLRAPHRRDLDELDLAIRETLPELCRWLPWARPTHTREDSRTYLRHTRLARSQRIAFEYLIEGRDDRRFVGMASLHRIDWLRRCASIGYWVRRKEWGQGFASEAGESLARHCFAVFDIHRLEAHVAKGNVASQRVVEKIGFQREGIARENELVNGRYLDHVQYGLLRRELLRSIS